MYFHISRTGGTCPLWNVYEAFGQPGQVLAQLVYANGIALEDPEAATPIGMGCKVCERSDCAQRAFPFVGRPLEVNENQSRFAPYGMAA